MFGFFSFSIRLPSSRQKESLVIFCSARDIEPVELVECIEKFCSDRPSPQELIILAPHCIMDSASTAIKHPNFVGRLGHITRYPEPPPVLVAYFQWNGATDGITATDLDAIKHAGLNAIVNSRNVVLRAPPSHHYVLPSGDYHCQQFLRIANAMVQGAEIDFLAYCVLPYIPNDVRHIYCDTGAISPIAYSATSLRLAMQPTLPRATVSSFGSFKGSAAFSFRDYDRSVILVSVSTGGRLVPRLLEQDVMIRPSSIIVLIALHDGTSGETIIGNLLRHGTEAEGIEASPIHSAHDCPLCKEGSIRIDIVGDQFLPSPGVVLPVILKASDAPGWLRSFSDQVIGTGLIHAHYQVEVDTRASKEVFFDLQSFLSDDKRLASLERFKRRLDTFIEQDVPAGIRRIIHLNDNASHLLAQRIAAYLGPRLQQPVETISLQAVQSNIEAYVETSGATLVVAGAIASGRTLFAAAQTLRHTQKNDAVNYLIGIARLPSDEAWRGLDDLIHREQPRDQGLHVVERVLLPVYGIAAETTWYDEREFYKTIEGHISEAGRPMFEARKRELDLSSSDDKRGLVNNLFWGSKCGKSLQLRHGFSFFDFAANAATASQADVFFTILSVLHHLRHRKETEQTLRQYEHTRRVLSPRCFDRFNDGVIQAALLRAARPVEMNYAIDLRLGEQMAEVIDFIFANSANDAGEASREFLLALAMKRLRLPSESMKKLHYKFAPVCDDEVCKSLWSAIEEGVLPNGAPQR